MRKKAEVYFEKHGLRIDTQYHPAFPEWIKSTVPPQLRSYDPGTTSWFIYASREDHKYAKKVYEKLGRFFNTFEYDDRSFKDKRNRWDVWREVNEANEQNERRKQESNYHYDSRRNRGSGRNGAEDFREKYERRNRRSNRKKRRGRRSGSSNRSRSNNRSRSSGSGTLSLKRAFQILGVEYGAPHSTVKKKYRKLAIKWHPDKNPDNREKANERMQEINAAYERLKT